MRSSFPRTTYVVNFSAPFFQSFLLKPDYLDQFPYFTGMLESAVIDLPEAYRSDIVKLFEKILAESENEERMGLDMLKALLIQLFIQISRLLKSNVNARLSSYNLSIIQKFLKLIEDHLWNLKLPRDYAELLYITPNHLNVLSMYSVMICLANPKSAGNLM